MKKKVLLLLSGQVRTYDNEIVINGWRKFRDKYDTTTFLCCWNNRGRSLYSIKHYSNDMVIEEEAINLENIQEVFRWSKKNLNASPLCPSITNTNTQLSVDFFKQMDEMGTQAYLDLQTI